VGRENLEKGADFDALGYPTVTATPRFKTNNELIRQSRRLLRMSAQTEHKIYLRCCCNSNFLLMCLYFDARAKIGNFLSRTYYPAMDILVAARQTFRESVAPRCVSLPSIYDECVKSNISVVGPLKCTDMSS
jgi:hypothetical protein